MKKIDIRTYTQDATRQQMRISLQQKKLTCRKYLNQPGITREQLYLYVEHLGKAHGRSLPNEVILGQLAISCGINRRAYEEVDRLAQQVEQNYNKRG